jgi:hypothetical protein
MRILKKTHEKKLNLDDLISFSNEEIIDSLEPEDIFIVKDLFLYTIKKDFSQINFCLIINDICVSYISLDVNSMNFIEKHTKEVYKSIIETEFNKNKIELLNLKNLITM